MATFHTKTRNAVRKGLSAGLVIERCNAQSDWERLLWIHTENMAVLGGRAKTLQDFHQLRANAPKQSLILTRARLGGQTVASLLLIRVGNTIEYITPAVDARHRSTQALSALIWTEMLQAIHDGVTFWNWGGTGWNQDSLYRFKSRLGGRQENYVTLVMRSPEGRAIEQKLGGQLPPDAGNLFVFPTGELKATSVGVENG